MLEVSIKEVVRLILNDSYVIGDLQLLADCLDLPRYMVNIKKENPRDDLKNLLISWVSGHSQPTIEKLANLMEEEFANASEQLVSKFPSDAAITFEHRSNYILYPDNKSVTWVPRKMKSYGFVGRNDHLKQMERLIEEDDNASGQELILVSGLGGIGKTELVKEFFLRVNNIPLLVLWMNAERARSLQQSIEECAEFLKISILDKTKRQRQPTHILEDIYRIFEIKYRLARKLVIVFDNVDQSADGVLEMVNHCLHYEKTLVIITSKNRDILSGAGVTIHLTGLALNESIELVNRQLEGQRSKDVKELCIQLENYPLALRQAVSYIKNKRSMADQSYCVQDYLEEYKNHGTSILKCPMHFIPYFETVLTVYEMTVNRIETVHGEIGRYAMQILETLAYLNPTRIYLTFLKTLSFSFRNMTMSEKSSALESGIDLLYQFSLIEKSGGIISLHRVVQRIARERMRQPVEHLTDGFSNRVYPSKRQLHLSILWETIDMTDFGKDAILQILQIWKHTCKDRNMIETYAGIPSKIFDQMVKLSMVQDSLQFARQNYDRLKDAVGAHNFNTMEMGRREGIAFKNNGKYKAALECYLATLTIQTQTLGKDHPATLETGMYIASVYERLKDNDSALRWAENTILSQTAVNGGDHSATMDTKHVMGIILCGLEKYSDSKKVNEEVYLWRKQFLGPTHIRTLVSLHNIGYCVFAQNKYREARKIFENVLKSWAYGEDHSQVLLTKSFMAKCMFAMGDMNAGLTMLIAVYEKQESVLGSEHPETLFTQKEVVGMCIQAKKMEKSCLCTGRWRICGFFAKHCAGFKNKSHRIG